MFFVAYLDNAIEAVCTLNFHCQCKGTEDRCMELNNNCGFRVLITEDAEEAPLPKEYVRKTRWYEKYYR